MKLTDKMVPMVMATLSGGEKIEKVKILYAET